MKLCKLVSTNDLSHEKWLEYRKQGIGGSDVGALCGMNHYSSPMKVYLDKTSNMDPIEDNEAMRQGRDLEQYVAERFCEQTGKKVRRANSIFYHPKMLFMLANVDRLIVGEDAGLECKTASAYSADKWSDGKIPESYELQCHHYMAVTGASHWYIACLILGKEFIIHKIERDEELIANLINIEGDFWRNHVLANVEPIVDGLDVTDEVINQRYPDACDGKSVQLIGFAEKLKRRDDIVELSKKLDTEKKQIEQEVKSYMEDAEYADGSMYQATWKNQNSSRIDSKKLKAEQPEIYAQYVNVTNNRVLKIKRIG